MERVHSADKSEIRTPELYEGDLAIDDRGVVGFVNGFPLVGVKRFYWVKNHKQGFVRAWHAHRREGKYFTVVCGAALIGAVWIDNWENPSTECKTWKYVLSSERPSVLYVPPGYANGFMSLTQDTELLVFSTSSLEESKDDDVRFPARYWDIWNIEER
jgi:dTDP-4-dehydrorhamnose 3,5-epimerase-like enzyme